jgi:hypothetical protein
MRYHVVGPCDNTLGIFNQHGTQLAGGLFRVEGDQGAKAKQPYAIAMSDGSPFGLGGLWENWKDPKCNANASPTVG